MRKPNASAVTVVFIILLAALSRLLPHLPNFAPIAAMALFGGAYAGNRALAFAAPLLALFISDAIIGFYPGMPVVYLSMMLITCIGLGLHGRVSSLRVLGASLFSSALFFALTNFIWLHNESLWPYTWEGMAESYVAALPFFRNTVLGDLFYNTLLFGGYALLQRKFASLRR